MQHFSGWICPRFVSNIGGLIGKCRWKINFNVLGRSLSIIWVRIVETSLIAHFEEIFFLFKGTRRWYLDTLGGARASLSDFWCMVGCVKKGWWIESILPQVSNKNVVFHVFVFNIALRPFLTQSTCFIPVFTKSKSSTTRAPRFRVWAICTRKLRRHLKKRIIRHTSSESRW